MNEDGGAGRGTDKELLWGCPVEPWCCCCHLRELGRQSMEPKRINLKPFMSFALLGFGPVTFLFLPISPFQDGDGYPVPVLRIVFWKPLLFGFVGSQLERNFLQEELYLQPHPYLT